MNIRRTMQKVTAGLPIRVESVVRDIEDDATVAYLELRENHPERCMCYITFFDDGELVLMLSNRQTGKQNNQLVDNIPEALRHITDFLEEQR